MTTPDLIAELAEVVDELRRGDCNENECLAMANRLNRVRADIEAMARDAARLDWADQNAHCLDWSDGPPWKRVIKADDGEESCADTWREAIDLAMHDSAREGGES